MKKRISAILVLLLLILPLSFAFSVMGNAEPHPPTRTINVVYDDSGSMIRSNKGEYCDTWCQAKYALEVFVAMLGEKDSLNIYYMSDYSDDIYKETPGMVLNGSNKAEDNVKKIHNYITNCSETPFQTVEKAEADLEKAATDEKWLVVLTDGAFYGGNGHGSKITPEMAEETFEKYTAGGQIKVMMLSMGPAAAEIPGNKDKNVLSFKAETSSDILSELTDICNQIFQNNPLPFSNNSSGISANLSVPMDELIVFAQGENIRIGNISDSTGLSQAPESNVNVRYCEDATTDTNYNNKSKLKIADNLNGYVAVFKGPLETGDYSIDVSGAKSIEVYFKPKVSIAAYLYNNEGEEVTGKDQIIAGNYRLEYALTDSSGNRLTDLSLLGNIEYTSTVTTGDGNVLENVKSGDTISITEGLLTIDVKAEFLDYNTVRDQLVFNVFASGRCVTAEYETPTFILTPTTLLGTDEPIKTHLYVADEKNRELTQEEWDNLEFTNLSDNPFISFECVKTESAGDIEIHISAAQENLNKIDSSKASYSFEAHASNGLSTLDGSFSGDITIYYPQYSGAGNTEFNLTKDGLSGEASRINVTFTNGADTLTQTDDLLAAIGDLLIGCDAKITLNAGRTDTAGEYTLLPGIYSEGVFKTATGEIGYTAGCGLTLGEYHGKINITDGISGGDRFLDWVKRNALLLSISLPLLVLGLGYVPGIKKYLPRKLAKSPIIECRAERIGVKDFEAHGKYRKNLSSTLIPYMPETGSIIITPPPKKSIKIQASGKNGLYITNYKRFAGNEDATFNGVFIDKECKKKYKIHYNTLCSIKTKDYRYNCYLDRKN